MLYENVAFRSVRRVCQRTHKFLMQEFVIVSNPLSIILIEYSKRREPIENTTEPDRGSWSKDGINSRRGRSRCVDTVGNRPIVIS